ncbi:DUF3261 domain-containing protein [Vibrio hannami]|uniref:DUF3261 domain-containing protein n=1 Tax=Vibrio hannami TaxID=2717094 RepID=UPI00240FF3DC|nr:DUF3261 domain-containing protein [Vibrio hannami]MDG3087539.1 DUF3261 domain-containing protein [Vibrio hannami]
MIRSIRCITLMTLLSVLCACASVTETPDNTVQVTRGRYIELPDPEDLAKEVSVNQLITVDWQGKVQQLPVKLEVENKKVVLAGFSSWGTRIFSLEYQSGEVVTEVLPGLEGQLPDPKQVLFYIMISLWPQEVWESRLAEANWQLTEQSDKRILMDSAKKEVVSIYYSDINDMLAGDIRLESQHDGYSILISTLD